MAILNQLISSIRIEIGDREQAIWQDDEIIRAIEKTVSLMSRLLPKRAMVTGNLGSSWIIGTHYLDISSILPNYIRIEKVEYPTDMTPVNAITFDPIGSYLQFRVDHNLTVGDEIRIVYQGAWTAPTISESGDYPEHLNDVVVIGSSGQSLIYKAEYYVHKAAETVGSSQTVLDDLLNVSFPDSPDITVGELAGLLASAKTTLGKAQTAFGTSLTTLGSMDSMLTCGAERVCKLPDHVTAAQAHLTTGAPLINAVTVGDKVGEIYGQYASVEAAMGRENVQSGVAYVQLAGGWEAKAGRQSIIANGYIQEATQYLTALGKILDVFDAEVSLSRNKVDMYRAQLDAATRDTNLSSQYLDVAGRYLASGQAKINEFLAALGYKPEFFKNKASMAQP